MPKCYNNTARFFLASRRSLGNGCVRLSSHVWIQTGVQAVVLMFAVAGWTRCCANSNLVQNPSFESDLSSTWTSRGFLMERLPGDVVHGNFALKVSRRNNFIAGPKQNVSLVKGGRYETKLYVRLLNDVSGKLWQKIGVYLQFGFVEAGKIGTYQIAHCGLCNSSMGWIFLNGSINVPVKDFSWAQFIIRGPEGGIDFLVDNVQMYEVPEKANWLEEAHANIDRHRKSNATMRFVLPPRANASEFDIQVRLKKHQFAFGSLVKDTMIAEQPDSQYSKLVFNMFNWATVQSYKWKFNKGTFQNPNYTTALKATNVLKANGLKVRGHSIFWDTANNNPKDIVGLRGQSLEDELDRRLAYMCNITYGKLAHWDVQNEHTFGQFYENALSSPDVTKNFFRKAKLLVNNTRLYFNDIMGVNSGSGTEELYQLMKQYQSEGIPVEGLGIQGHSKLYTRPDPTMMWRRLDRLAMTHLELFITEFDVINANVIERADWLEDAFRAFFGHPRLSGVILWGFWDRDRNDPAPDKELVRGGNLTILEPGQRYICLVKKEWTTNLTRNLGEALIFDFRGFHGDYEVVVRRNGVPVQLQPFSLTRTSTDVTIEITGSTKQVTVQQETDYVPACVSHRGQESLGNQTSSSTDLWLTCKTVTSPSSGGRESDQAAATCGADEVMTGCTSHQNAQLWTRQGEKIVVADGVPQCSAHNGDNSPAGVTAQARCCKLSGLMCDYRKAGPSSHFDGALSEATCPLHSQPLGCAAYSRYPDMDGAYVDINARSCVAQSGDPALADPVARSGSEVFASCCSAPRLNCTHVTSAESGRSQGNQQQVRCPPGYVMVSCSYFAQSGRSGGASIILSSGQEICTAFMGAHMAATSSGVKATATCCTIAR